MADVSKSPFIGIGLDESTDRASEKHVVFIIRYCSSHGVKTTYLTIKAISDGKAKTMVGVLHEAHYEYGVPFDKVSYEFAVCYQWIFFQILYTLVFLLYIRKFFL